MKKFLITLFVLLALGCTVFFIGWPHLKVPPGAYGVIISKTHGVDLKPVKSGEFRWLWYKLIPTNVKIPFFNLDYKDFTVNLNSELPSGSSYAAFAGLGADFSWKIKASVSFRIDPEKLTGLAARKNITDQNALNDYEQEIANGIELIILRTLTSAETDSERLEKILAGSIDDQMNQEIAGMFQEICDFSFTIQSAHFPDFVLYRQVRLLYEEFLAKEREYVSAALSSTAEKHIESQFRFNELERYGVLLTKYPVLLEYITLEKKAKEGF